MVQHGHRPGRRHAKRSRLGEQAHFSVGTWSGSIRRRPKHVPDPFESGMTGRYDENGEDDGRLRPPVQTDLRIVSVFRRIKGDRERADLENCGCSNSLQRPQNIVRGPLSVKWLAIVILFPIPYSLFLFPSPTGPRSSHVSLFRTFYLLARFGRSHHGETSSPSPRVYLN